MNLLLGSSFRDRLDPAIQYHGKVVCVNQTVAVHPTAQLTGEMIQNLYSQDLRLVRHDHDCLTDHAEGGGP